MSDWQNGMTPRQNGDNEPDYHPTTPVTIPAEQAEEMQRSFVLKVYGWMTAGLLLTGVLRCSR